ncbi:hypothetical protein DIE18_03415 [Burkholderia sp. Bp9125]|nr:hypothetical protein DIE18_03415 [Burkholderia sp. Bp9125]
MQDKQLQFILISGVVAVAFGPTGLYIGHARGVAEGLVTGISAGYERAVTVETAKDLARAVSHAPVDAVKLTNAMCAGFRETLPCESLAQAVKMEASSNVLESMRGKSCHEAITALHGCGADVR